MSHRDNDGMTAAPEGQIWVCGACGKRARTMYGFDREQKSTALDRGWDESCMMNAVLCYDSPILPWTAVPEKDDAGRGEDGG